MLWQVIEQRRALGLFKHWHVIPHDDLKPHTHDKACWCKPEDDDDCVYIHNAMDGREPYEAGTRIPH